MELSIHTGLSCTEKAELSWWWRNLSGWQEERTSPAPLLQNTLPCCWPAPEMAATLENSRPATLSLSIIMSRAWTHMMVGAVTFLPALWTPPAVRYSGNMESK